MSKLTFFQDKLTLIKRKQNFSHVYKNIQIGFLAKTYMRKGFLKYEEMHNANI
jgi:hypothetical protein